MKDWKFNYLVLAFFLIVVKDSNGCSTVPTTGGNQFSKPCVFPFIFQGETFHNCTSKHDSKPWCSTKTNKNTNQHVTGINEWGHCDLLTCRSQTAGPNSPLDSDSPRLNCKTTANKQCKFPFKNNGKTYNSCTRDDDEQSIPWCSYKTDSKDNHIKGSWEYCNCDDNDCCSPSTDRNRERTTRRPFNPLLLPNEDECAISREKSQFVVGGVNASPKQFPFAALIGSNIKSQPNSEIKYRCGGSLISDRYVLSAAHCFHQKSLNYDHVVLGELDLGSDPDCSSRGTKCAPSVQKVPIEEIIVHPEYTHSDNFLNDIALIRLRRKVQFNDYVRPICLITPSQDDSASIGSKVQVIGWGKTSFNNLGTFNTLGASSQILQFVKIDTVSNNVCRSKLIEEFGDEGGNIIDNKQICAGNVGKDSCNGDSGGPLIYTINLQQRRKIIRQMGIVSFGSLKCGDGNPGVYTRVASFRNWIIKNMRD